MPTVRPRTTIYLWEFLLQLLDGEENCAAISWVNRERGEFVLKDQSEIAKLWGRVKGRPRMDKIKLGRAMRYYYKKKLLAKVPRRKAVYRFMKFDHLKEKQAQIIRHEDFPEIDYGENPVLIHDDKSEGESSLPAELDGDEDDTPLESLLTEKNAHEFQDEKYQRRLPDEEKYDSIGKINDNACSLYDRSNNATDFAYLNDDCFAPCREVNPVSLYEYQSYPSCTKNAAFEPINYNVSRFHYQTVDCNNYPQYDVQNGGHLASLLLNSILMSDQQILQDAANSREGYSSIPLSCTSASGNVTPEAIVSPSISQIKTESLDNNFTTSVQFQDVDTDSAWNTLKEFERLLMINRSF